MPAKKSPSAKKVAELKLRLLADPNTLQIAKTVGLTLDAYVKQVMHFIEHPNTGPELVIASDEDLRSVGFEPPDPHKMAAWLEEAAEMFEVTDVSKFANKKPKKVVLESDRSQPLDEEHSDPRLKSLLEHELRGKRSGKT